MQERITSNFYLMSVSLLLPPRKLFSVIADMMTVTIDQIDFGAFSHSQRGVKRFRAK
jgi:hypothetical protein